MWNNRVGGAPGAVRACVVEAGAITTIQVGSSLVPCALDVARWDYDAARRQKLRENVHDDDTRKWNARKCAKRPIR